jgi:hypothetical protein
VLRTSVPEATVNEHCNTSPRKHEVGLASKARYRATVDEISQSECVNLTSKRNLG